MLVAAFALPIGAVTAIPNLPKSIPKLSRFCPDHPARKFLGGLYMSRTYERRVCDKWQRGTLIEWAA